MIHKYTTFLNGASLGTLTGAALLLVLSNIYILNSVRESVHEAAPAAPTGSVADCTDCDAYTGSSALLNEAQNLQKRLSASGGMVPSVTTLVHALEQRDVLLERSVNVRVSDSSVEDATATWTVSLKKHPELVTLSVQWSSATFTVDKAALSSYIAKGMFEGQRQHVSTRVTAVTQDKQTVTRAVDAPIAHDGFEYDSDALSRVVANALEKGNAEIEVTVAFKKADVIVALDGQEQSLTLLASGLSDFSDSPEERVWNVHKAIDERINNIVVKPGEVFSFNNTLGGPVTLDKGWREGLGLFGGGAALTPGAGICQAATTVFRAALLAGFPIVEKRNHSMWVDHYEPYGAGLDATIFPGVHDMRFRNDTKGYLLIQAYVHSVDDVTVQVYGISDDRTVSLDGPYFYNTKPRAADLKPLGKDQVGWVRTVTHTDGRQEVKPLVATYHKGIPRFVFEKYAGTPGTILLHALVSTGGTLNVASAY